MVTDQATHEAIEYVLTRGVVQVEKDSELRRRLSTGKPLRIKLGVDPSGREDARKPLTAEQVKDHATTYLEQFFRIVDPELTEVHWQSEWYNNFDLGDAIKLQSQKTV